MDENEGHVIHVEELAGKWLRKSTTCQFLYINHMASIFTSRSGEEHMTKALAC